MGRQHIEVEAFSKASPDQIWDLLSDVTTWSDWGPWDETAVALEGSPEREGPGAIRHLRMGRRLSVEVIVAAERPTRLVYRLLDGLPVRNYLAEVTLEQRTFGTMIRWCATFDGARPLGGTMKLRPRISRPVGWSVPPAEVRRASPLVGMIMQPLLRRFIRRVARRLARAAEAGRGTRSPHSTASRASGDISVDV